MGTGGKGKGGMERGGGIRGRRKRKGREHRERVGRARLGDLSRIPGVPSYATVVTCAAMSMSMSTLRCCLLRWALRNIVSRLPPDISSVTM